MVEEKKKAGEKPQEKPKEPEMVSLKEVAKQAGLEPREARAHLRKLNIRGEDQKRSRWQFLPKDVPVVVKKLKDAVAAKEKAKEEAAAEPAKAAKA